MCSLRLSARVRMAGDIEQEKRRDSLIPGHMRDGGEVTVLLRIVAELLPMAKLRLGQTVYSVPRFRGLNYGRHVIGVSIDGYAAFDDGTRQVFRFQVALVGADQRGQPCTSGKGAKSDTQFLAVSPHPSIRPDEKMDV